MAEWTLSCKGLLAIVALSVVAACGGTTPAPDDAAAKDRARMLLIDADQLPKNYRAANGQDYPGELKVCGVRLEPEGVRGFAMKRYTRTVVGPFLYEFVFVGSNAANQRLVHKMEQRLETCSKDIVTGGEGRTTYEVSALRQLPRYGQASVAFRLDPRPRGIRSEYVLIKHGDALVLLFTVAPGGVSPPRALLADGAKATMRQLRGGTE